MEAPDFLWQRLLEPLVRPMVQKLELLGSRAKDTDTPTTRCLQSHRSDAVEVQSLRSWALTRMTGAFLHPWALASKRHRSETANPRDLEMACSCIQCANLGNRGICMNPASARSCHGASETRTRESSCESARLAAHPTASLAQLPHCQAAPPASHACRAPLL